jgi:hypothetical protein
LTSHKSLKLSIVWLGCRNGRSSSQSGKKRDSEELHVEDWVIVCGNGGTEDGSFEDCRVKVIERKAEEVNVIAVEIRGC